MLLPATASANEQERLVRQAELVVESFLDDETHQGMRVYVQNAFGVLVVPDLLRAGFFIGAEVGRGVLLVRDLNTGQWSNPAFYDIYGGSLGIQFGGKASDVVFTIMNREAIDQLLANRVKLGTDASVAFGPVGAGVGAATSAQFGEDFYLFARSKGLYGGLSLDGSMVFAKPDWNNAYYGAEVRAVDILLNKVASNPNSNGLREALGMF
jgi:lipid-binding SYLF domain-containing protein